MMRKAFTVLLVLLTAFSAFAVKDSAKDLLTARNWDSFSKAAKCCEDEKTVLSEYEALVRDASDVDVFVATYRLVKYYADLNDSAKALVNYEKMASVYERLPSADAFLYDSASLQLANAEYLAKGGTSRGLKNLNIAHDLYRKYPDEVMIICAEAWRYLSTPALLGGSASKALSVVSVLDPYVESLTQFNLYDYYIIKATAYNMMKNFSESRSYVALAQSVYPTAVTALELLDFNARKAVK